MHKTGKIITGAFVAIIALYSAIFTYFHITLPCNITTDRLGGNLGELGAVEIQPAQNGYAYYLAGIPVKTANVTIKERPSLIPCGTPFGVKCRSDGAMVVSVTANSPADRAGIRTGDVIYSINGVKVNTNSEVAEAVQLSSKSTKIGLMRDDKELSVELTPTRVDSALKIGAWVRDSAAGIGTLTYVNPLDNTFGGLGHAVSDVDTGLPVPLGEGEITEAEIYDVVPGKSGSAGELCGTIMPNSDIGELYANTTSGVFGTIFGENDGTPIPMAYRQEVKPGSATIMTTIDGNKPREYSIEIERINLADLYGSKGMIVRITDPELLAKTGGIVRGMSGSPIIQDGRLVGAVTHVLVNDPTRGYAVFAESMIDTCENYTNVFNRRASGA
ncbi:MAG: SpoIVB peptidase [Oscillospiraceae bacterium]|nr:SpoIVB peptidase [Oscillospiraceae bacterium]